MRLFRLSNQSNSIGFDMRSNTGEVIAINQSLIFKRIGKLAAYCAQSTSSEKGTFIEGNWYGVLEPEVENIINDKWEKRKRSISLEDGTWVLIQQFEFPYSQHYQDIERKAYNLEVLTMPDSLPENTR